MRAGPPVRESGAERQRAGRVAASERCTGSQPALPRHGITLRSRRLLPITAPRWPTRRSGTWTRCRPSIRRWRRAWGSWQTSTGASCGTRHARAACCSSAARGRSRTAPARPTARSTLLGGRGPRPASRCALSGAGAQLTAALEDCLALPELRQEGVLLPIYHSFVASFAHKLNPLRLAQLAVTVAQQGFAEPPRPLEAGARTLCPRSLRSLREACARARGQASARAALCARACRLAAARGASRRACARAVAFLEGVTAALAETKQPRLEQPTLYLRMHVAQYQLTAGDVDACKAAVAGAKDSLDALQDVRLRRALRLCRTVLSSRHGHPATCPFCCRIMAGQPGGAAADVQSPVRGARPSKHWRW